MNYFDGKVSVCLASYNGSHYIKEQILSILLQLKDDDELIISDDSSTDNTVEIIHQINDKRITLLHHNPMYGLSSCQRVTANFENALLNASGDAIFLSDQDDVWLNGKVDIMCHQLEKYYYVTSDCFVTDSNLNIVNDTRFIKEEKISKNKWGALFKCTPYQGSCSAFRRDVLSLALPFPSGIQSHDRWIGFVASFFFSFTIIPDKLIYYRRHEQNVSTTMMHKSNNSLWLRMKYRIKYIINLLTLRKKYYEYRTKNKQSTEYIFGGKKGN